MSLPELDDPRCPGCRKLYTCECPTLAEEFIPAYKAIMDRKMRPTDVFESARLYAARRQDILDMGIGLATLDEYQVLTLKLAEAAPTLLRALKDVMALRDELKRDESKVSAVSHAFANEIDRALKGQR